MILKKLIVGALGTNCYVFASEKEAVIIDPGGDEGLIIKTVEEIGTKPIAVLLTHGHFDHTLKLKNILRHFKIPLMYNKKEYDSGVYTRKEADRWLVEGDTIQVDDATLHVLETPGHSPGSLCYYCKNIKEISGQRIEGLIFTGDLLFRRSIGRSDVPGGNQTKLFASIKNKLMYNVDITDEFLVFPGHMGNSSIGDERKMNIFKRNFL